MKKSWWAVLAVVAAVAACKQPSEQESARAEERLNLLTNPNLLLLTSEKEFTGDVEAGETEAQLLSVDVYNSSHFAVGDLGGDVVWLDDQERRVGATPFSLRGTVAPGGAKRFTTGDGSMTNGKLQRSAAAAQVVFTHVKIIE